MSIRYQGNAKGCLQSPDVPSFLDVDFTRSDLDCWPPPMLPLPTCLIKGPTTGQFAGSTPRAKPLKVGRSAWFCWCECPGVNAKPGNLQLAVLGRTFSKFSAPSVVRQFVPSNLWLHDSVVRQFGGRPTSVLCDLIAPRTAPNSRR